MAIQYFLRYLAKKPDELEVKWLLNLTYMTLGQYPASVPQKYLLPPALFTSTENIGRFKDVAPEAGLNLFVMASGVIVDDFDNDGLFEVVTTSWDSCEPMHYLHNNGKGIFTDQAEKAGLSKQLGGLNLMQTDYNNDGCLDILVLRGAWQSLGQRKSLLRNNCDGTFTDVTQESGLAKPATNTQAGVWADINNDGFLDLFVGNENGPSQLFLNKGDGTFTDISHSAGIDQTKFTKGVVAEDYDNDGYVDFYVSNVIGYNFLYHNKHDGTFAEIADQAGVPGTGRSFATWFFDYDNDGLPDVFDTAYQASVDETVRTYLGLPHNAPSSRLYKNLGNGAFRDVTKEVGLDRVFMPMGANFGDVDNDGYLDIYLGTGDPSYASLVPNILFHNKEGKSFVDITASSGTGDLHKGHGVAFVDIDNDGDEDIFTSIGGAVPGDRHAFRLFENPGNGNDWISLRLVGSKSNRAAIGARIKVTVKNEGQAIRAIYRTVGSGGSFGASPLQQHIGLGKAAQIVSLEITWPGGSRTPQIFSNVGKNQFLEIKEFAAEYTKLERRPYHLGGPKSEASIPSQPFRGASQIEGCRGYNLKEGPMNGMNSMKRRVLLALVACIGAGQAWATERYPVTGLILKIDRSHQTFVASCAAIPNYMEAMTMPFSVRDPKLLDGLESSMQVDFTLVVEEDDSYAENIKAHSYQNLEQEPLLVRRLQLLDSLDKTNPALPTLSLGQPVSDFTLIDQTKKRISLAQFSNKVVAITFIYTSCPLPNYCFRLSSNFGRLQKRFADQLGRDLILLSITIDPVHDQPEVMAKYAETWKADPNSWHFLTGSLSDVKQVCRSFGVNYWPDEGTLTHSLHTVVIDRQGKLVANFEGNEFTAEQLGDFVATKLR